VLLADPAPTPEAYRAGLERSRLTAERLSAIINELLVDARGRARTIDRRPTDLTTVVRSAVDVVEPLATKRRISIDLDAPEALPCAVDESNVLRAVTNLIDNAVRYAPADTVVAVELTSDAHEVCVAVTDHGPGVPPADQEAVFERFWRTGEQAAGTGLGLSISQHIARAHGGAITLTSPGPAGDGSRFELRLPIPDRSVRPPSERDE